MRTTVEFDDDIARAVVALRRERHIGVSDAVNQLIRQGLLSTPAATTFRQRTQRLGLLVDISNVADTLESLEGPTAR